jgi:WD40 repeat protein
LDLRPSDLTSVAFSPDGKVMITGDANGQIKNWDVAGLLNSQRPVTGSPRNLISKLGTDIASLVLSSDTRWLISVDNKNKAHFFNQFDTHTPGDFWLYPCTGSGSLVGLTFRFDGKRLAAGNTNVTCIWWPEKTINATFDWIKAEPAWSGQSTPVTAVAYSSNGKYLASGAQDGKIMIQYSATLAGSPAGITVLVFSPDGKSLAAGGADGVIYYWQDWQEMPQGFPLYGHKGRINDLAFTSNASALLSASQDGKLISWDLSLVSPDALACKLAGRNPTEAELASFGMKPEDIPYYLNICTP